MRAFPFLFLCSLLISFTVTVRAQSTNTDLKVRWAFATNRFNEISGEVALRLVRDGTATNAFSVEYAIESGTAEWGADYSAAAGTVYFAPGQNSSSLTLSIIDDAITEGEEFFAVRLVETTNGASIQEPASTTIVIADNDRPGGVDPSFDSKLGSSIHASSVGLQSDGSLVFLTQQAYGYPTTKRMLRLTWDGRLDGVSMRRADDALLFVVDSLNRVISVQPGSMVIRFNSDGSHDTKFGCTVTPKIITAACAMADGSVAICGGFTNVNGQRRHGIARISSDAKLLPEPNIVLAGLDPFPLVRIVAPGVDGSLVFAGTFTHINGAPMNGLAKLTPQGTVATNFTANSGAQINTLAVLSDGRVLAGGAFSSGEGEARKALVCLLPDGRADTNFAGGRDILEVQDGFPLGSGVHQILVDADQRIYILGNFTHVANKSRPGLARLLPNGEFDEVFNPGEAAGLGALELMALGDGTLTISGRIDGLDSAPRTNIVRLFTDMPVRTPKVAITRLEREDGGLSVSGVCNVPMRMQLETSANLQDWEPLAKSTTAATNAKLIDTSLIGNHRFYRVRGETRLD